MHHVSESPWVITLPLILLAVPSVLAGLFFLEPLIFGDFLDPSIHVLAANDVLGRMAEEYRGIGYFIVQGVLAPPFWLALAGTFSAWLCYLRRPQLPALLQTRVRVIYVILCDKYGFDVLNDAIAAGGRGLGRLLWRVGDERMIDGAAVNGTARAIGWLSGVVRQVQSGYVYHYAFAIILGVFLLMTLFLHR